MTAAVWSFKIRNRGLLQEGLCSGSAIISCDSGAGSTLGFCATRNGVEGYVTAGHSADRIGEEFTYNGTVIGEVPHTAWYQNTTADAGFIRVNTKGTLTNYIMGYSDQKAHFAKYDNIVEVLGVTAVTE